MKTQILLSCLLAGGFAVAQGPVYTTPVGYVTEELKAGQFNLIGLTLQNPTVLAGSIVDVDTDNDTLVVAEGALDGLDAGKSYLLEIRSGDFDGAVLEVESFDSTLDEVVIAGVLPPVNTGDAFGIREVATLGSVFGTGDDVVIGKGTAGSGDLVYIPQPGGGFQIFHHTESSGFGPGSWTRVGGGGLGANTPIVYTDAVFVNVRSVSEIDLVIAGEVKTTKMLAPIEGAFEYVSGVFPVGSTLNSSGIANSDGFQKGTAGSGDLVLIVNPAGGFRSFYHTQDSGFGPGQWVEAGGSGDGSTEITSGIIIQRRAAQPYNLQVLPPASYSTL